MFITRTLAPRDRTMTGAAATRLVGGHCPRWRRPVRGPGRRPGPEHGVGRGRGRGHRGHPCASRGVVRIRLRDRGRAGRGRGERGVRSTSRSGPRRRSGRGRSPPTTPRSRPSRPSSPTVTRGTSRPPRPRPGSTRPHRRCAHRRSPSWRPCLPPVGTRSPPRPVACWTRSRPARCERTPWPRRGSRPGRPSAWTSPPTSARWPATWPLRTSPPTWRSAPRPRTPPARRRARRSSRCRSPSRSNEAIVRAGDPITTLDLEKLTELGLTEPAGDVLPALGYAADGRPARHPADRLPVALPAGHLASAPQPRPVPAHPAGQRGRPARRRRPDHRGLPGARPRRRSCSPACCWVEQPVGPWPSVWRWWPAS